MPKVLLVFGIVLGVYAFWTNLNQQSHDTIKATIKKHAVPVLFIALATAIIAAAVYYLPVPALLN